MHPILFQFKSVTIYSYGFFVAVAVGLVYFVAIARSKRFGIEPSVASDLVFLIFVSGIIGARLFYVLQNSSLYQENLWRIFWVQEGGLVWYGGFIVSSIAGLTYALWKKWPLLDLCDFFAPLVPLAHALGRLGCFFNGCCYGAPTTSPLGVIFHTIDHQKRLPTQLIEAFLLLCLSAVLFLLSSDKLKKGERFIIYVLSYSVIRFGIEFFRADQSRFIFLTFPQWTSLILIAGTSLLWHSMRKKEKNDRL